MYVVSGVVANVHLAPIGTSFSYELGDGYSYGMSDGISMGLSRNGPHYVLGFGLLDKTHNMFCILMVYLQFLVCIIFKL